MKKKKNRGTTVLLLAILLAGAALLAYPSFSNYWNSFHQTQMIAHYAEEMANVDAERYQAMLEDARNYNETLLTRTNMYLLDEQQREQYESLLDVTGLGTIGYIEIPSIDCTLPIYHGTSDGVLQVAVGHLDWTSLPVGGESTHAVLSGHRGLPSAKLFTDLDKLIVGDLFMIRVLDEVLTYEVDQIRIVEPHETSTLLIEPGKDLCTLVTCTPYGINTHRLLVRGHRVANVEKAKKIRITADAVQIEPLLVAPVVAMPVLLILMIWLMLPQKPKYHGRRDERDKK